MANELNLKELALPVLLNYARELATVQENMQPAVDAVQELFPFRNVDSLTWEFYKGQNVRPVMGKITPFDTEAPVASRRFAGEKVSGEMPKFAQKIPRGEREELLVNRALQNAATPSEVQEIIRAAYDDVRNMRDAVLARPVKLALDLLYNTDITVDENNVKLNIIGAGVPAANLKTPATPWDQASADPYKDEMTWLEQLEDAGINTSGYRVLTSKRVIRNLLKNDKLREMIYRRAYNGAVIPDLTEADYMAWREAQGLPPIATLDAMVDVQNEDGTYTSIRLFPQDRYILLPPGKLGDMLVGPTVEAMRAAQRGIISYGEVNGIWVEQYTDQDPPITWTKAVAVMFPTFPTADKVISADVL